jgi:hypothetical protein
MGAFAGGVVGMIVAPLIPALAPYYPNVISDKLTVEHSISSVENGSNVAFTGTMGLTALSRIEFTPSITAVKDHNIRTKLLPLIEELKRRSCLIY